MDTNKHAEHDHLMADMRALNERSAQHAAEAAAYETTVAQVRRMAQKETHPTWMHAAYADLAGMRDKPQGEGWSASLVVGEQTKGSTVL